MDPIGNVFAGGIYLKVGGIKLMHTKSTRDMFSQAILKYSRLLKQLVLEHEFSKMLGSLKPT